MLRLGRLNFRGDERVFGIESDDRMRHIYILGATGVGKSTLLENMIIQDMEAGRGVCVIDPHGDLAEKVLSAVPKRRSNEVVYFDPSDKKFPLGFNILEEHSHRHLLVSGVIGVFKKMYADSWGPRLEYILRNTILALLDYPNATLLEALKMLSSDSFREKVTQCITDPVVKEFWTDEFAHYSKNFKAEAIAPIQNKIGQFLSVPLIRNIVGQKCTFNVREIMDSGKILILNLSKGKIGEDNASLLGALMINKIQIAAMSRADIPESSRKDFFLYIDEFQNFSTESYVNILSEARKYRLSLTMANQYIKQLDETVRDGVFGNCGTVINFRCGAEDAEYLEKYYDKTFNVNDMVGLPKYHAYLRLMIQGVTSTPFSAVTLPPQKVGESNAENIVKQSRLRYSKRVKETAD